MTLLGQLGRLEDFQRAVREQFAKGGSLRNFLILWGTVIAFVVLCRMLWRMQQRISGGVQRDDPRTLFKSTMRRLGLTRAERRCLRAMLRSTRIEHPTSVLLSPNLFDQTARAWRRPAPVSDDIEPILASLRRSLFPPESM